MKDWLTGLGSARWVVLVCALAFLVGGCTGSDDIQYREFGNQNVKPIPGSSAAGILGFNFGGGSGQGNSGIGVNTYLWRASLDTVSFMPLVSADPFGGVIITDWYQPPESPYERFKMIVYILDTKLRVDGVKVNVFRQQLVGDTEWKDAAVSANTGSNLENAILTRARQMRIKSLSQ